MSAQSVWNCICSYNSNSATEILKAYSYNTATIIQVLGNYPDKDEYHGHESGQGGDGEHQGAATKRANAIQFLLSNVPETPPPTTNTRSAPNHAKKKANEDMMWDLLGIISGAQERGFDKTMPQLEEALTKKDSHWRENRKVSERFEKYKKDKRQK
jgi:hypothetical protein